ncbi:MAG: DUF4279 domain-containing protein [Chloroflexi bacterium]|nr:DUF4279 domain-containing protein [Chloroflexota bacterium]
MSDVQDDKEENLCDEFIGRLYVSLSITGKEISPNDITAKLGIQPEQSFKYGEINKNSKGEERVRKSSYWCISSDNKGFSQNDATPHFEWLIGILEPVSEKIKEILSDKNIEARITCFWITPDGRINLEVEPGMTARLASLNMKIWFDIYCNH